MRRVPNTSSNYINSDEYNDLFNEHIDEALERALDTRKFEINLYWRRATYFWTFIGATFGGFFIAYASTSPKRQDLLVILCCLGGARLRGFVLIKAVNTGKRIGRSMSIFLKISLLAHCIKLS